MDDFRATAFRCLADAVPEAEKRFDAATGRFGDPTGGWSPFQQEVIFPLALLYVTEVAENPRRRDPRLLEMAVRGGDVLRSAQDDAGRLEFIKPDGSTWGRQYIPWTFFQWLMAFDTLRNDLAPSQRAHWEAGLRRAYAGVCAETAPDSRVHNIPLWNAMALFRAGQVFGEDTWRRTAESFILRSLDAQHPDGYWPEGGGPSTSYNTIYVGALGLYHHFSRDPRVLPALERALEFHLHFTYPDGAAVETVDGRVRYHRRVLSRAWTGFLPFPRGRGLVRQQLDSLRRLSETPMPDPHVALACLAWPAGAEIAAPSQTRDSAADFHGRALLRRRGPWFTCLSGYLLPDDVVAGSFGLRFHLDRQNYLSVWHQDLGLLIGGGNSKYHPAFSTFSLVQDRARFVQADAAQLASAPDRDTAHYRYGRITCALEVRPLDDRRLEIAFSAQPGPCANLQAALTLLLRRDSAITTSLGGAYRVHPKHFWTVAMPRAADGGWIAGDGWRLALPSGATFTWPNYPYNPYALDFAAPEEDAVAVVAIPLVPGEPPKRVLLEVQDPAPA